MSTPSRDGTHDHTGALLRHFVDLRDGTHFGARSRGDKDQLFGKAVALIDPYARRALSEINDELLLGAGEVAGTGVRTDKSGGVEASPGRTRLRNWVGSSDLDYEIEVARRAALVRRP